MAVDARDPILQLPIYVAAHERMFAAQRLKVSLTEFPDGAKTTAALAGGAYELASSGFELVLQAGANAQTLTAIVLLSRSPMLSLIAGVPVRKKRGPRLGIESIGVVGAEDPTGLFAKYISKVQIQPKGSIAAVVAAFEERETGGAVLNAGTLEALDLQGVPYTLLADTRTVAGVIRAYGVSTYPASCVFANSAWLAAHKDQARRTAKALVSALAFIRTHTAAELASMLPGDRRSATVEQARPLFSKEGTFPPDAADAARKVLAASYPEFRKFAVPPTAYTNEFIEPRK